MRLTLSAIRPTKIARIVLLVSLVLPFGVQAAGEDAVCVFISQQGNAWVIRKDSSVKSTLKIGDPIFEGDKLVVTHGNNVQLAFDKQAQNVVQIDEDTTIKITGSKPANINLDQGRIFAILDKPGVESHFKVFTPTAVAAVRGTHYQVNFAGQQTQVSTYRGEVRVAGRDAQGRETKDYVLVGAGKKTTVESLGKAPSLPQDMSAEEKGGIEPVLQKITDAKEWTKSPQAAGSFASEAKSPEANAGEPSKMVKSAKEEKKQAEKGLIVF